MAHRLIECIRDFLAQEMASNVLIILPEVAMNNASLLIGKSLDIPDGGEIGSVHDLYFDDQTWSIRYLVVDTGKWLPGRKVLVSPEAIVRPWHHERAIPVKLTREQIQSSPDIDADIPVSRATEESLHQHYEWTPYWDSTNVVDARFRSANELAGYHVKAGDGEVGQVEDLLLDDDLSRILFLVVEVKGWLFGKKVLAGPSMISRVDWANYTVHVDANRQALKNAQEYNPAA